MYRFVLRPSTRIEPRKWAELIRASLPLGIMSLFGAISFRTSVVLLGLFAAGSADVGEYGAAFRLVEATLFLPASFNAAALPWFSRHEGRGAVPIARGFEMATKTVFALVLPIGLGMTLFAEPLIETLYGSDYSGAVTPLRLLGAMVVLWGVNATMVTVLVSRNRPDLYTVPALVALVPNLGPERHPHPTPRRGRRRDRGRGRRGRPHVDRGASHGATVRVRLAPARAARAAGGRLGDGPVRGRPPRHPLGSRRDRLRGGLRGHVPRARESLHPRRLRLLLSRRTALAGLARAGAGDQAPGCC